MKIKHSILPDVTFIAFIMLIAGYCFKNPFYNWDMLPYMAVVISEESSVEERHMEVYKVAEAEIPPRHYQSWTDPSNAFRAEMHENADTFSEYLSFFRIKPLYTFIGKIFHSAGVSLSQSILLPSILGYLGIVLLSYFWLAQYLNRWLNLAVNICIALFAPLLESARLATPDALWALLILACFYFILKKPSVKWLLICSFLAVLTRLDNIIPITIILVAYTFLERSELKINMIAFILSAAVVIGYVLTISFYADFNGSLLSFYAEMGSKINSVQLLKDLKTGLATFQFSSLTIVMAFAGLVLFFRSDFDFKMLNQYQFCFIILFTFILIKFLLFPDVSSRHYLGVFALAPVLVVGHLSTQDFTNNN